MRTALVSVFALTALAAGATPANAQFRARGRVVVSQPYYVTPVAPVVEGVVVAAPAAAPAYVAPSSLPGYVGPFIVPGLTIGRGYNFYPGLPYNTYPNYRYWR